MKTERIRIADASRHVGETVEIPGWLYNLRKSGKIVFPLLRDGTGLMQCVAVKSALPEPVFESIKELTQESSVMFTGKIRADARAAGGYEMDVEDVLVVQRVPESDPYPITPKDLARFGIISIPTGSRWWTRRSLHPRPVKAPLRCSK